MVLGSLAGLLAPLLGTASGAHATEQATARAAVTYSCQMDAFGHTASGRIKFLRVENTRVRVSKSTSRTFAWRPVSWGLVSMNRWPGHETTTQLVPSTDGRIRLVETQWETGSALRVRVLKVVGSGYPGRLVAFDDRSLYWAAADRSLHRATWNGRRFVSHVVLPVRLVGATALTAISTDYGMRLYYTDADGAFHLVVDRGGSSTDTVLRTSGYRGTTGLRAGWCRSRDHSTVRPSIGILSAARATGVARFQRATRAWSVDGGATTGGLTDAVRVPPGDWTWRHLG